MGSLVPVPEVDESKSVPDRLESLPPPLTEFYDHWTAEDDLMDDADTDTTVSDAKEFLSNIHCQDDNDPDASGAESDGEDCSKADLDAEDQSSDDNHLVANIRQQLASAKPPVKRVPAEQKQPTKSTGKGSKGTAATMSASPNNPGHPATCGVSSLILYSIILSSIHQSSRFSVAFNDLKVQRCRASPSKYGHLSRLETFLRQLQKS